jgi:hypothetical protein
MLRHNQIAVRLMPNQVRGFVGVFERMVTLTMPSVISDEAIGAHPVLIHKGVINPKLTDPFAVTLHPRSVLARNRSGQTWIIAIDTRVSLPRAAQIAQKLGATEAINLDGGGSTTFVVRGKTVNNPADKAERYVASAVLVVEKTTKKFVTAPKKVVTPKPKTSAALGSASGANRAKVTDPDLMFTVKDPVAPTPIRLEAPSAKPQVVAAILIMMMISLLSVVVRPPRKV